MEKQKGASRELDDFLGNRSEDASKRILAALEADEAKIDHDRQAVADPAREEPVQVGKLRRKAYKDNASGKIDEALRAPLNNEFIEEMIRLQTTLETASSSGTRSQIDFVARIFEPTQITHNKYLNLEVHEQGRIAKIILSNCKTDGVSLTLFYRNPFDLVIQRAKKQRMAEGQGFEPWRAFQPRRFSVQL